MGPHSERGKRTAGLPPVLSRFRHRRQLGPDFTRAGSNPSRGAMSSSKDEDGHLYITLYNSNFSEWELVLGDGHRFSIFS